MRILIEGDSPVRVSEPDDLSRLHVELSGVDPSVASAALAEAGLGRIDGTGYARVDAKALRALAEPAGTAEDWAERWSAMLGYARGKGWVEEEVIRVHVVTG